MNVDHRIRSLRESTISNLILLKRAIDGDDSVDNSPDIREFIRSGLDDLLEKVRPDPTGWPGLKTKMFYDVYLLQRTEEGTIMPLDWVRPGLTIGQFSDNVSFHQHCIRVGEIRKTREPSSLTKWCSACGEEKSIDKFKHRGGSKCNACNAREYRERKNAA